MKTDLVRVSTNSASRVKMKLARRFVLLSGDTHHHNSHTEVASGIARVFSGIKTCHFDHKINWRQRMFKRSGAKTLDEHGHMVESWWACSESGTPPTGAILWLLRFNCLACPQNITCDSRSWSFFVNELVQLIALASHKVNRWSQNKAAIHASVL